MDKKLPSQSFVLNPAKTSFREIFSGERIRDLGEISTCPSSGEIYHLSFDEDTNALVVEPAVLYMLIMFGGSMKDLTLHCPKAT